MAVDPLFVMVEVPLARGVAEGAVKIGIFWYFFLAMETDTHDVLR